MTRQTAFTDDDNLVTFASPTSAGDGFKYVVVELDFNGNTTQGFFGGYMNYGY